MEETHIKEESNKLYEFSHLFNAEPLTQREIDFIIQSRILIPNCGDAVRITGKTMTLNELFTQSVSNLSLFQNPKLSSRVISSLQEKPLRKYPTIRTFATNIAYTYNPDKKSMSPKGIVDHMKIPSVYGEESPILLTHEFIHILKDTNINEYNLMFRYSEIIPLLYEIIEYNKKEPSIRTSLIRNRYIEIREEISTLIQTIQLINKDPYNKDKYLYVLSQAGKYILNLYYALLLYDIYLTNPDTIINEINKVFNHEITTQELLINLGIYNVLDYNEYKEGIKQHLHI